MFSGIIEKKTKAIELNKNKNSIILTFARPKKWRLSEGESICIDGICSTVSKITSDTFSVYYMSETLSKTHLIFVDGSHEFNLEQSLRLTSLVGGHLVSGHIDTVGKVVNISKKEDSSVVKIEIPPEFSRYIIYKGSICVNGVSLTVVNIDKNVFTVSLIPYTLAKTNLGSLKVEDLVNIEVDLLAKYLEKLTKTEKR
ncbi:riboflavin synthase [Candidatus Daviesbacteria bacterium]|nr:riboflavin synthase [Candidatus Daviesbacteria bacterium]